MKENEKQNIYNALYSLKQMIRNAEDIVNSIPETDLIDPKLAPVNELKGNIDFYHETIEYVVEAVQEMNLPTLRERILLAA